MENTRFIALTGAGYWGRNILRNLLAMGVLRAVCDRNEKTLEDIRRDYPEVLCTPSFDDILCDPGVKAVAIATPAKTHYELTKKALLAGKDVFVEKPLSLRVNEGEELVTLAKNQGRILMVGHILQYHPAVHKLKEIVCSGTIGEIHYLYAHRLNAGRIRTEENVLWSFAPHDVSVFLSLLGEDPLDVTAFGGDYVTPGTHDAVLLTLTFPHNIRGHIFVSWLHPFKEQRMVVIGSHGMVVFDDVAQEKLLLYPHKVRWNEGIPSIEKAACEIIPVDHREPLREELLSFVECVRTRAVPLTDGNEGLRVLRVLEAAEQSLRKRSLGGTKPYFVHETSCIDDDVVIGEGTRIWHFSHILKGTRIGRDCTIGQNVMIGPDVTIGNRCKIQNNVSIYKGVTLEDEVFCGPSCVFTNVHNPRAFIERKHEFRKTLVKRGATIGANATIICGVTIGRYAFVGAGAVVTRDVPDYALVVGVPARQIGWACKCGVRLTTEGERATCHSCGSEYRIEGNELIPVREV